MAECDFCGKETKRPNGLCDECDEEFREWQERELERQQSEYPATSGFRGMDR